MIGTYRASDYNTVLLDAFWSGREGRKITITADSSTVDIIKFYEYDSTLLMELTVTYSDATHDTLLQVEKTA